MVGNRKLELCQCQPDQSSDLYQRILQHCKKPDQQFDWPWRTYLWSNKFGNFYEIRDGERILPSEWKFEGTFHKIHVKTRSWENRKIIQGFQTFLDDGSVHAFGMDLDDTRDVQVIKIPNGKSIRDLNMSSSWYVDMMEFIGDDGKKLGRVGNNLLNDFTHQSHFGFALDSSEVYKAGLHFNEHFLSGMRGRIMITEGLPCICDLQFKFTFIPPPPDLKKHYDEVLKKHNLGL